MLKKHVLLLGLSEIKTQGMMTAYHSSKKSWNFVFRVRENKCFCWGSVEVLVQIYVFDFLSQIIGDATGSTLSVFLCLFRSLSPTLKEKTREHYNSCSFSPHFLLDYRVGEHLQISPSLSSFLSLTE